MLLLLLLLWSLSRLAVFSSAAAAAAAAVVARVLLLLRSSDAGGGEVDGVGELLRRVLWLPVVRALSHSSKMPFFRTTGIFTRGRGGGEE